MAYSTPKENWTALDIPVASDFNRIEGNAHANHDGYIAADAILTEDVSVLQAALATVDFVNGNSGVYGTHTISTDVKWVIPKGLYMMIVNPGITVYLTMYNGSSWDVGPSPSGLILSDGINYRIWNADAISHDVLYRKLA
jgi:hypothetical protein